MQHKYISRGLLVLFFVFMALPSLAGSLDLDTDFYQGPTDDGQLPIVKDSRVKNVIILIGDGYSLAQQTAAQIAGPGLYSRLHMQRMPIVGISITASADRLITDSAAGATAISTGHKTDNYVVGQLPDSTKLPTVLELAKQKGMATGAVVTSAVTHATPACFVAHVPKRSMENEIAEQIVESDIDLMLGGGLKYFAPKSDTVSVREDDRNLLTELEDKGYTVALNREQLDDAGEGKLIGLFAPEGLNTTDPETPGIVEMTRLAIDRLSKEKKGFFLMVEGSQIDWGGHANEEEQVVRESLNFDMAVGAALKFAEEDGHTLVIVTSDHETGGMSIRKAYPGTSWMMINFSTDSHTPLPVPTFAYGPHAIELAGVYQNTHIAWTIADVLGLKGLLPLK